MSDVVVGSWRFRVDYRGNVVDDIWRRRVMYRYKEAECACNYIWAKVASVHGPADKYPTSKREDLEERYYTYHVSVKGRKKDTDKDGKVKRWLIDLTPTFPGIEFDSAEGEYLKRRNDIFTSLYMYLTRIDHCNSDLSKTLVGIFAYYE